ncbi:MAG TPA: PIG-L deacetylase family protein [Pseudonocardiaceae bacterium]|nr:PIG-L deacetylase family protein [Pseudonocardiaceae bacterium]
MWQRVLAVGAHPDDIEFGCGGTLLRHAAQGAEITVVVVSDGARGGEPLVRATEQARAAELLGAKVVSLGLPDGDLGSLTHLVTLLEQVIADTAPDVVYTHLPEDTHQDHVGTHRAMRIAARGQRNVLLFESPRSPVLSTGIAVDVSDFIQEKAELLSQHASQTATSPELREKAIRARALLHGLRFGCEYAEIFTPLRFSLPFGMGSPLAQGLAA